MSGKARSDGAAQCFTARWIQVWRKKTNDDALKFQEGIENVEAMRGSEDAAQWAAGTLPGSFGK